MKDNKGHFIPLDNLKLEEDSRVLIRILEEPEQPQGQTERFNFPES